MFSFKRIFRILLYVLLISLFIYTIVDAVMQYKKFTSQQSLIDEINNHLSIHTNIRTFTVRGGNNNQTVSSIRNGNNRNAAFDDSLIVSIKKSMQNTSRHEGTILNASYNLSIPRKYIFKYKKQIDEIFDLMRDNRMELEKLCVDGIHRLEGYITYGYGLNSLIQVAGIIKGFYKLFDNIVPSHHPYELRQTEKKHWFRFIVYLTRLLAMYEFIGNDKTIKDTICVWLINKIIPAIDKTMGWKIERQEMVYIAIPRLLNSFYSSKDRRQFLSDVKSDQFKKLGPIIEDVVNVVKDDDDDLMIFEGFYKNLYHTFYNYALTV
ncbi:putative envelope protein ODV-E66-8 [Microplitis demolitor]|uniref:putative envelope protein ODV-E66-8 n=1 Tax=Microplitis demolitor TaxID=69319 RepID=UPI00043FFD9C|nr:putative envelope protein ODV-E66-8 [Microplitis demolitor]KAG6558542.1 putative envelope protein ODV-E66-8 [Microplitis demolitor]